MNAQQYAASGVLYTYQPAASVSYVSPSTAARGGRHAGDGARRALLVRRLRRSAC